MKINYLKLLLLLFLLANTNAFSQTKSSLSDIAKQNSYQFEYNQSFSGEGWEKVLEAAAQNKYFILGEDHGLAQVPLFTQELVSNVDYDLFVTEIDSVTASIISDLTKRSSSEIQSFLSRNPSSLSFYSAKEEFELLQEITESDIWGLDQVSLFSTGIVLRELSKECQTTEAKELTIKLAKLSDDLFLEASETGNYDTLFIYSSKKEVFDQLRDVLANESTEAKNIFSDIEMSWKIYNRIGSANYNSRIGLMKSKLLNYYINQKNNGKQYDKALYKFGAYHVSKAESMVGGFDVGNLVSNLAHAEGESSYHLMIVGKSGEANTFLPTEGMKSSSFDIGDEKSPLYPLSPFAELVENKWVLFDLVPLRRMLNKGTLQVENSFLRRTIYGYDALIIIPKITASKI